MIKKSRRFIKSPRLNFKGVFLHMIREPSVENKYNLKPSDITKLKILDRTQIKEPLFWRNDVVRAWCISKSIGSRYDEKYGTDYTMWIGIYDEDARVYKNKIKFFCTCYGGMCSYDFASFFDEKEIENEYDLMTQETLLRTVNDLIDRGILGK